jgi:Mce-associated membrane protein
MVKEGGSPSGEGSSQSDDTDGEPLSVDEAATAATEAADRAREARAQAQRLRRHAKAAPADQPNRNKPSKRHRRWRLPRRRELIAGVGVALICASSAASGSMWWQHRVAVGERQLAEEFTAAARRTTVTLLALDYTKIREDIQRVIDNSTGAYKSKIQKTADAVAQDQEQSQLVTIVDVKDVAVESMSNNAGVVLVAVQTESTEKGGQPKLTSGRLALSLAREDGQLKISGVKQVE